MRAALALVVVLGLSACPRLSVPVEAPRVSIADGAIVVAPGAREIELVLTVGNANRSVLRVEAVDWELAGDEVALARGRVALAEPIAAGAASPVRVAIVLTPAQSARLDAALADQASLSVAGTVHARLGTRGLASDFWQPVSP